MANIEDLKGKTLKSVELKEDEFGDYQILFRLSDKYYVMYHDQDCCEHVYIEDIDGDINDLVGHPILIAEEVLKEGDVEDGTYTWTFYKIATNKGSVTIRWYGESNGCYAESVDFKEVRRSK